MKRNPKVKRGLAVHCRHHDICMTCGIWLLLRSTLPPSSGQKMRQHVMALPGQRAKICNCFSCCKNLTVVSESQISSDSFKEVPYFIASQHNPVNISNICFCTTIFTRHLYTDRNYLLDCCAVTQLWVRAWFLDYRETHLYFRCGMLYILGVECVKVRLLAPDGASTECHCSAGGPTFDHKPCLQFFSVIPRTCLDNIL
jgi:hypothetical protein